jgi:hypothetical protein
LQISSLTIPDSTRESLKAFSLQFGHCSSHPFPTLQKLRSRIQARTPIQITRLHRYSHINMGPQKDPEGNMTTNATSESPISLPLSSLSYSSSPGKSQSQEHMISRSRASLVKRMTVTFATQSIFLGICLVALNWMHGKYDFKLNLGDFPWWQLFSCFGVANICARVVLNRAGLGHVL